MTLTFGFSDRMYITGRNRRDLYKVEKEFEEPIFLHDALDYARQLIITWGLTDVDVCSATTGEVYATFTDVPDESDEDDEDDYEDDYSECGYNPYMGCYDYDC